MKSKLKNHAVSIFRDSIQFLHYVLDNFPDNKLTESIGSADPPMKLLIHIGNTGSFWMKKFRTPFEKSLRIETKETFFEKMDYQLTEFEKILENENEIYYKSDDKTKPRLGVPWIMIRTANHAMHHAAMLIQHRHIHGLPPLNQNREANWSSIVDLPGVINYSELI